MVIAIVLFSGLLLLIIATLVRAKPKTHSGYASLN